MLAWLKKYYYYIFDFISSWKKANLDFKKLYRKDYYNKHLNTTINLKKFNVHIFDIDTKQL